MINPIRNKTSYALALGATCAILLVAGCNLEGSENITYVVIPAGSTPPTGEPVFISPTATPAIPPEVLLQVANLDLHNGYYESATASYQSLLARTDAAPEIRTEAAFKFGQAALRAGLYQDAVDALTKLITQFPTDPRSLQAYFLRGDAYMGLFQWQNATNDFNQYLALRPGLIDSYVYERIGDAQLALGQYDSAFANYLQAADAGRSLIPQLILREKIARLHTLNGDVYRAVAQFDAILSIAQNAPYRAEMEFLAAQAMEEGCSTLMTVGGVQTNHGRLTAATAAKLGMKSIILTAGVPPNKPTGNIIYDGLFGCDYRVLDIDKSVVNAEAYMEAMDDARDAIIDEYHRRGDKF